MVLLTLCMVGFTKGTITAGEALKYGQIGIGTLDGADGEVIILDGTAYHGNSENQVRIVKPDENFTVCCSD